MAVHFKFKSARDFDSINIEGHYISVANLKESILEAKNFGRGQDDLVITNAQTGEDYSDDAAFIARNTSVLVRRVPSARPKILQQAKDNGPANASGVRNVEKRKDVVGVQAAPAGVMDDFGVEIYTTPEVSANGLPEDDEDTKISEVAQGADWSRQVAESSAGRGFGRGPYRRIFSRDGGFGRGFLFPRGAPPPGYVCHRCGQPGHFIQLCPTNGDPAFDTKRVKPPVGIPKDMLVASEGGSLMLPDGQTGAMRPNENAFDKEIGATAQRRAILMEPPEELCCPVHKGIIEDAVMISCCLNSCCDECGRKELSASGKCPLCGSVRTLDDILPNYTLRKTILRFKEMQYPLATSSGEAGTTRGTSLQEAAFTKHQKAASPLGSRSNVSPEDNRNTARLDAAESAPPGRREVTQTTTVHKDHDIDTVGESAGADSLKHDIPSKQVGIESQKQGCDERLGVEKGDRVVPMAARGDSVVAMAERGKEFPSVVSIPDRHTVEVAEEIALGDDDSKGLSASSLEFLTRILRKDPCMGVFQREVDVWPKFLLERQDQDQLCDITFFTAAWFKVDLESWVRQNIKCGRAVSRKVLIILWSVEDEMDMDAVSVGSTHVFPSNTCCIQYKLFSLEVCISAKENMNMAQSPQENTSAMQEQKDTHLIESA